MEVINLSFLQLSHSLNAFCMIFLPVIDASMKNSTDIIERNNALDSLLSTSGQLFRAFYDLLVLTLTCAQCNIPRARLEGVLYPDFGGSYFPGRNFYHDLVRCEHLFWTLTGESVQSFDQIVQDCAPRITTRTRRRQLRVRDNPPIHP